MCYFTAVFEWCTECYEYRTVKEDWRPCQLMKYVYGDVVGEEAMKSCDKAAMDERVTRALMCRACREKARKAREANAKPDETRVESCREEDDEASPNPNDSEHLTNTREN